MDDVSRRRFLSAVPAVALVATVVRAQPEAALPETFPRQDPLIAREIVGASHGNVARVKELVSARPALARAVWDWGYGDWETALGAASHVGNPEIAAVLLAAGAHPTIFSAAMLGQLAVVQAMVAAAPGIQKTRGPHGITLLDHARAGGDDAMVRYLESLGDADPRYRNDPMTDEDVAGVLGTFVFGAAATDRLTVSRNPRGLLVMKREGEVDRNLFHQGARQFLPAGAEAVTIRFEPASGRASMVHVVDGPVRITARR